MHAYDQTLPPASVEFHVYMMLRLGPRLCALLLSPGIEPLLFAFAPQGQHYELQMHQTQA